MRAMRSRTLLLLALLGVVAAAAWYFQGIQDSPAVPEALVAPEIRPEAPASAATQYARVEDNAAILAPFAPRLSRMSRPVAALALSRPHR